MLLRAPPLGAPAGRSPRPRVNSSSIVDCRRSGAPRRAHGSLAARATAPSDASAAAGTSQQQPAAADARQHSGASASTSGSCEGEGAGVLASDASLLRRVLGAAGAGEALDLIVRQLDAQQLPHAITADDGELLLERSLAAGNTALALSVYQQMCAARSAGQRRGGLAAAPAPPWPAATLQHTETLVVGLCRQLRVPDALAIVRSIRSQGMQGAEEVSFGHVVSSPLPPGRPLAVVQPQEGSKVVSDASTRYEFELFSGTVTNCRSEALQPGSNPLLAAARALGLWRRQPVAAVHELVVQAPGGASRTFRVGTATADVPAQPGERVTVVCAPERGRNRARRLLLSTSAPGTQPGEALLVSNHATGAELPLLRPPLAGSQATVPGWLVPAAVLLAGGDAASGLLDPALPLLITGGLAATVGGAVAGNALLLPRLKQLPASAVKLDGIRQQLLAQHAGLNAKVKATMQEAAEDVRTLARLCQLQAKMQSVDGGAAAYEARIERVVAAAEGIEARLAKRLELLDGYARVMNMIEIEVEMDMQVPIAELEGLGVEMEKLSELESIREEWQVQAEAQDEVEKLLRSSPALPSQ